MFKSPELNYGQREDGLRYLTKLIAEGMNASIVRFWTFNDDKSQLFNECYYSREQNNWFTGETIRRADYPIYFSSFDEDRLATVENIQSEPSLAEFRESYIEPFDIQAFINAPVLIGGKVVGLLCCEVAKEKRQWTDEDRLFILNCTDFFSRVIEADQRQIEQKILRAQLLPSDIDAPHDIAKSVLMAMPYPLALLDSEFRFVAVSASWRANYPKGINLLGMRIQDAQENFRDEWLERLRQTMRGEQQCREESIEMPDKSKHWISWHLIPWRSAKGNIEGVLCIYEDITTKKETEFQLRQATKLTALGEMAGGIAHEINNPLSILKGFIDLMRRQILRGNTDLVSFQLYLERAHTTVERISRIVKGMKRLARDSSGDDLRLYAVNALIDDALDFVQEKFRDNGIGLKVNRLEPDAMVECRSVEISQVLLNLFTNSFHAIEAQAHPWITVEAVVKEGHALIYVEDSGDGILVENRDKIFQPFFTTKDVGKGMGLGLSISKRIVESHGGKLYLDTEAVHTRFVVELPLGSAG